MLQIAAVQTQRNKKGSRRKRVPKASQHSQSPTEKIMWKQPGPPLWTSERAQLPEIRAPWPEPKVQQVLLGKAQGCAHVVRRLPAGTRLLIPALTKSDLRDPHPRWGDPREQSNPVCGIGPSPFHTPEINSREKVLLFSFQGNTPGGAPS